MNNTKANLWLFNKKTKDFTFSYEVKEKFRFIKGSLLAVISGLIVGGIIIAIKNVNPFEYLKWLFTIGFNDEFTSRTISWLCIYIVAALAVGIGFKSGMFNMGVSGQMMMGGGIAIIYYKLGVDKMNAAGYAEGLLPNAGQIILIFLICVGSGAIIAGLAGLLKALFNIHEVVTTIMLNWTVFYLMKYLFTTYNSISGSGIQASGQIPGGSLTINGSTIAIPIIIAIVAVIVISLLLSKSTFGFKIKSIGASPSASKYAGYDVKKKMVEAMLISGALAGCASFISIFTIAPQYTFNVDTLPTTGYDAVAITLVAFNNPIGTVFSSFLWSVLQSAGSSAASMFNLPTQMSQLIFGVIVYFAAISVVFIKWYPILKLKIMIAMTGNKANQVKVKNLRNQQLKCRQELMNISKAKDVQDYKKVVTEQISELKKLLNDSSKSEKQKAQVREDIKSLKNEMNEFVKEYRKNLKEQIKKCSEQIKIIKKENYVVKINSAREGINRRQFNAVRDVEQDALSKTSLLKSNVLNLKDKYAKDLKAKNNWLKDQLKDLRKEYKLKRTQNDVWLESETGIKNHFWEMRNGKIEAKAQINKMKINAHNEILNIKSDSDLAALDLKVKFRDKPEVLKSKLAKLRADTNAKIKKVKSKLAQDIQNQKDNVKELAKIYKESKRENENMATQILIQKKSIEAKLRKNLKEQKKETKKFAKSESINLDKERDALDVLINDPLDPTLHLDKYKGTLKGIEENLIEQNQAFGKILNERMGIKKALVDESEQLLKDLRAANEADIKAVDKINNKHNSDGASLVDIRLAYNQRMQLLNKWYKESKQALINQDKETTKNFDDKLAQRNYAKVQKAIESYKKSIKAIGANDDTKSIEKKKKYLDTLISNVKKIWPDEYSELDNAKYSKLRYKTYLFINDEQYKLSKIQVIYKANMNITMINAKSKYIKKMYNQNIKDFRNEYLKNKKVNAVKAQQTYHSQIERFISKLEHTKFTYDQLQEAL